MELDGGTIDDERTKATLETLGKSYSLDILNAIAGETLSARAISREAEVPSTTLYRRLDDLVDVGLVERSMELDPDGGHYTTYRASVRSVEVARDPSGYEVDIEPAASDERSSDVEPPLRESRLTVD